MSRHARAPFRASAQGGKLWPTLRREWPLWVFCTGVAAIALLYNLFASPDVLYDEAAYTTAAQKVALGWQLTLGDNKPLFVHPPLMFLVQAAWLTVTGHAHSALPPAIPAARMLAASVGIADVLLVALLTFQLAGRSSPWRRRVLAALAGLLTALDPVLVRYDRQDVIEPFALCISLVVLNAAWALWDRKGPAYVCVTGLLGGLALLTNQITIFLVMVPLIFSLVQRDGPLIRRSGAALGIALGFYATFFLWAVELGLGGSFISVQTATLQRLIGLVQISGLNSPGVSLPGALVRSVAQYSSSYIILAIGLAALVWCWTRINTDTGSFLTAWLTASYGFGAYIVAIGTLNEQFFVYILPASIAGSVFLAEALIVGWGNRITRRHSRKSPRLPLAIAAAGCAGILGLSAVSWMTNYIGPSDGVVRLDNFVASTLPSCAVVNASGDADKYMYLLAVRQPFVVFAVGPAALAYGVHYFVLAPNDAIEHTGNMTPELANWIEDHGRKLVSFPSQVYKTVQLWYVPASPYNPVSDVTDIPGGVYVNTVGSRCGGYTITDTNQGSFYSNYQELGGKGIVGDPLSRVADAAHGGYKQLFDGVVLADGPSAPTDVRALPIVAMLAARAPVAYRRAGLPAVVPGATTTERRGWLTNRTIAHTYLGGKADTLTAYSAAVQRYGEPLGPPSALPGGGLGQAFADIVLEAPRGGGSVHAAAVTPVAVAAGLASVPAAARDPQSPPPVPGWPTPGHLPFLGPPEPMTVEPFVLTLADALLLYGLLVRILVTRRRRRPGARAHESWRNEAAS